METSTTIIDALNAYFDAKASGQSVPKNVLPEHADLYEVIDIVEMPVNSTFDDIKLQVETNNIVGFKHKLKIGGRCVIAERKYTWQGRVAKTSYLHIFRVNNFKDMRVIEHWREQKNGSFKTI